MIKFAAALLLWLMANESLATEYVQLSISGSGIATNYSETITLTSQQSALYMVQDGEDADSSVAFLRWNEGSQSEVAVLEGSKVTGPATIRLRYAGKFSSSVADVTVVVMIGSSGNLVTDDGIAVVPADNGEPVTVVIETSTDLENWVIAQPGDYAMTDKHRFFRVSATRKDAQN